MFQVMLAQVEQALAGHGRVVDAVFFRHQIQHRVHQRRLAGS
jgi:hypothetical protein